ncbi:hypothetical protein CALCODRAFT_505105 [Calocera cornea HHB12733]|uniref:Uncharacterized protein n=1 Tax=Calocera cornea HHB12733 TaxID=1353952 RepID=A0A165C0K5_9BASI|nr:hypothetical protein CALCODRAFT_505105 [Calocera cornea HHB12733]
MVHNTHRHATPTASISSSFGTLDSPDDGREAGRRQGIASKMRRGRMFLAISKLAVAESTVINERTDRYSTYWPASARAKFQQLMTDPVLAADETNWYSIATAILSMLFDDVEWDIAPQAVPFGGSGDKIDYVVYFVKFRGSTVAVLTWEMKKAGLWEKYPDRLEADNQMRCRFSALYKTNIQVPFIFGISSIGPKLQPYIYDIDNSRVYPARPRRPSNESKEATIDRWFPVATQHWFQCHLFRESGVSLFSAMASEIKTMTRLRFGTMNPRSILEVDKANERMLEQETKAGGRQHRSTGAARSQARQQFQIAKAAALAKHEAHQAARIKKAEQKAREDPRTIKAIRAAEAALGSKQARSFLLVSKAVHIEDDEVEDDQSVEDLMKEFLGIGRKNNLWIQHTGPASKDPQGVQTTESRRKRKRRASDDELKEEKWQSQSSRRRIA